MSRPSSCNHEDWPCCGCGEETRDQLDGCADIETALESTGGDSDEISLRNPAYDGPMGIFEGMDEDDGYRMSDAEADADTLRSAGMGTDEDYGDFFGHDDDFEEE